MSALILDGKLVAEQKKATLKQLVLECKKRFHHVPGLAVILVGENPASHIYVSRKQQACEQIGIRSFLYQFPATLSQKQLLECISELNQNPEVDGILVQLPLPSHIDEDTIILTIDPDKDVDGFHPMNMGKLAINHPGLSPCTPRGIMHLLNAYHINPEGMHAVILGRSNIVGRPMALELISAGATVTICHSKTNNLAAFVKSADIIVAALGNPDIVKAEWLNEKQIIIDVGINRTEEKRICGDIPFDKAQPRVRAITPVPGGVGPMTIVTLLDNCVQAAMHHAASNT